MNKQYELNSVQFIQDNERPYIVTIRAAYHAYDVHTFKIGYYNFKEKYGSLTQLNGKHKEYKQFQSLMNYFFKQDDMFVWNSGVIESTKQYANGLIKAEKTEHTAQLKAEQTEKANMYLSNVINRDQATIECLSNFADKTDNELIEIINNTFKNKISKSLVNEILTAIKALFTEQTNITVAHEEVAATVEEITEQPEVFHLYSHTFNTYSEAFNYACEYNYPVHMILSSNHPSMTNERLQQLEKEYTFSKMQMSIEDKREYFNYLSTCQRSLDQENRYYKLKSWIERYDHQQNSINNKKEMDMQLTKEAYAMVKEMESNGLIIESTGDCGISSTKYILDGKVLHNWIGSGGISTDQYYEMIKNIYNQFRYKKTS